MTKKILKTDPNNVIIIYLAMLVFLLLLLWTNIESMNKKKNGKRCNNREYGDGQCFSFTIFFLLLFFCSLFFFRETRNQGKNSFWNNVEIVVILVIVIGIIIIKNDPKAEKNGIYNILT